MSRCFSSLPRPSRSWSAPHLFIRSSLLLSQSSGSSCVSHELLGWVTRREAGMEEQLIYYSKGITRFPSLTSTPTSFPHLVLGSLPLSQLQISEGRDALTQVGGLSWLRKPSQLLMSLRSALLASGALVRELRCEDLSGEFVPRQGVESRQRKQNGNHCQHDWLQGDRGPLRLPV